MLESGSESGSMIVLDAEARELRGSLRGSATTVVILTPLVVVLMTAGGNGSEEVWLRIVATASNASRSLLANRG
jgi:hypothetical protein